MSKYFSFLVLFLFLVLSAGSINAQNFSTGAMGVIMSDGGRIRIETPAVGGTRQIDRASILVASSPNTVFDYNQDGNSEVPTYTVATPLFSNFEMVNALNNTYNTPPLPPDVLVWTVLYGWTNGAYTVIKVSVKNREATAMNAIIGVEVIPKIAGVYGNELCKYIPGSKIIDMYKASAHIGLKLLSAEYRSVRLIDWFDGYAQDTAYYRWLNTPGFDPDLTTGVDGAVAMFGQTPVTINPGDSADMWMAFAYGATEAEMIANMQIAEQKYLQILPVELTSFTAFSGTNGVELNWKTATETNNYGFEIQKKNANVNESAFVTIAFINGAGTTADETAYYFRDKSVLSESGKFTYRLKQVDFNGQLSYSDEIEVELNPTEFAMFQNYPNPFNPSTNIGFQLPLQTQVSLKIYDVLGNEVETLVNEVRNAGKYTVTFNADKLSNGVYFYKLETPSFSKISKMILMK
ncbi:MAG: T9SS type A sorting domain-containing protein [Ignavibacteriaceae bacterium]